MAYTEAKKRANIKYLAEKTDDIRVHAPKGTRDIWKAEAEKHGLSLAKYLIETVNARIATESAQEAAALGQAITALAEAHSKPYTVAFHTLEQLPTGRTKLASGGAQKVVQASSEAEARVAFFGWLKEQMQTEVAFEDATRIGIKRDDGVIEICEIVSVE